LKIALLGYGKMGKSIEKIALAKGHHIVFTRNSSNKKSLHNIPKDADCVIDFSTPNVVIENIHHCLKQQIPIIVGTTGWYTQITAIKQLQQTTNSLFLYASNFSIGVNLFFAANQYLASLMNKYSEYDVEIEEIHHTEKLDSPSGTAISIAKQITNTINRKEQYSTNTQDANKKTLNIFSHRKPGVVGDHFVTYQSNIDQITLSHEAKNRLGFASGAILAAEWLIKQPKGFYTMKDVLNLAQNT